jgi:hypothetical protein
VCFIARANKYFTDAQSQRSGGARVDFVVSGGFVELPVNSVCTRVFRLLYLRAKCTANAWKAVENWILTRFKKQLRNREIV